MVLPFYISWLKKGISSIWCWSLQGIQWYYYDRSVLRLSYFIPWKLREGCEACFGKRIDNCGFLTDTNVQCKMHQILVVKYIYVSWEQLSFLWKFVSYKYLSWERVERVERVWIRKLYPFPPPPSKRYMVHRLPAISVTQTVHNSWSLKSNSNSIKIPSK